MALVLADRVKDTTTTAGTGTVTLSGTPPTGFQSFAAIGNGNTTYYTIAGGSQWEVGIGTYSSTGPTLSRDTVLSSSTGSKIDFAAGTKDVFVTYPSGKAISDGYGLLPVTNGGTGTATQFTAGSVVFAGASGVYSQDNANLFWDNTNDRLGIGTTTPAYALTIDSGNLSQITYATGSNVLVQRADGSKGSPTAVADAATIGGIAGQAYDGSTYRTVGAVRFSANGATSPSSSGGDLLFQTCTTGGTTLTTKMRLDSVGNLGLGVTPSTWGSFYKAIESTAASEFCVTSQQNGIEFGRGYYKIDSGFASLRTTTQAVSKYAQDGNGVHAWSYAAGGSVGASISWTQAMTLDASGNLGVGTASPSVKLHVAGGSFYLTNTAGNQATIEVAGNGNTPTSTSVLMGQDPSNQAYLWNRANAPVLFGTNNTEKMRLDASGNLAIGVTTVAGIRLYVRTAAITDTAYYADNGSNSGFKVGFASGLTSVGNDFNAPLAFLMNNAEVARFDTNSNFGIGTASPTSGFRLDVVAATARIRLNSSTGTNTTEHRIINTGGTQYFGLDSSGGSLTGTAYASYNWYSGNYPMIFAVNNGEKMRLQASGGLSVGTTTDPGAGKILAANGILPRVNAQTTTASPWAWNSDLYDQQSFSALANALTINVDAGTPTDGEKQILRFKDNGTGRVLTFTGGSSKAFRDLTGQLTVSGSNWTYTTVANKTVYFGCVYNSADARWDIIAVTAQP